MNKTKLKSFVKRGIAEAIMESNNNAVEQFLKLVASYPDNEVPPLYFWKKLVSSGRIALKHYQQEQLIGLNEINHTADDRGNSVIAIGAPGSLARFAVEHPDSIKQMRDWAKDCEWEDVHNPDDVDEFDDIQILQGVQKYYAGGIKRFIQDGGDTTNKVSPPITEKKTSKLIKQCVIEVLKENLSGKFPNNLLKEYISLKL